MNIFRISSGNIGGFCQGRREIKGDDACNGAFRAYVGFAVSCWGDVRLVVSVLCACLLVVN